MTRRLLLASIGSVSLALGVLGIFLPLLPTTPFLLLSGWCFANSSERAHQWLLQHPQLGAIIHAWHDSNGLEPRLCYRILGLLWLSLTISMLVIFKLWAVLMLSFIGASVSVLILRKKAPA